MPTAKAQANLLTQPSLVRGVIQVIITRGARPLLNRLGFKPFTGESYAFNRELTLPSGSAARDPYGTTIPSGTGTRARITVEAGMLARDADTAKIDVIGKSDINPARKNDILMAAKALAEDFVRQFLNGVHDTSGSTTDYNLQGVLHWLDYYVGLGFTEQSINAGGDGLSLRKVDDLLSRYKGDDFQMIVSNRETWVAFLDLLNAAGGNTATMFSKDEFGMEMFKYRGKPWVVFDPVGEAKSVAGAGAISSSDNTLTISSSGDGNHFIGFNQFDVGRTITVAGAGAAGATLTTTIASVTSNRVVELTDAASTTVTEANVAVAATNQIIALRFDEVDGLTAIYHKNRGVPADPGEYQGPIVGFDVEDIGLVENGRIYRAMLDWFGNFVMHRPYNAAILWNFDISES